MREKMIELLKHDACKGTTYEDCYDCEYDGMQDCFFVAQVDHLIANGVTLDNQVSSSKWIPVTERLPENDYGKHWKERPHYLVCLANGLMRVATFGFKEYAWWIDSHSCVLSKEHYREVTHWMPLPEPPKGE